MILILKPYSVNDRVSLYKLSDYKYQNNLNQYQHSDHNECRFQWIMEVTDIEHSVIFCPQENRICCQASASYCHNKRSRSFPQYRTVLQAEAFS